MNVLDLITNLGEKENSLTSREFISPFFNSDTVYTYVNKILYSFKFRGKKDPGWYKFRPVDLKKARITGEAEYEDIHSYLNSLPVIRIVLIMKQEKNKFIYLGLPLKNNKFGFDFNKAVQVLLPDDLVMDFDMIIGRFDGANIWFDCLEPINDSSKADYLRGCLENLTEANKLRYAGLTIEEKAAYAIRLQLDRKYIEDRKKSAIQREVEFGGGKFIGYQERKDFISVTFEVDGESYTTQISNKPDHQVISAGVCLSGGDRNFDLTSLVTVLREGQSRNLIHRW